MRKDEFYMQRALELARLGAGNVSPNPMVGAVIVHENHIIGEGCHQKFGEAHAEVNAVNSVKNKSLLQDATIYVSLEPCAHFGNTPPCADLICKTKFKRVVVACEDVNAKVSGKGLARIKSAGIQVDVGVLEKEAVELNRRFFTFQSKNRPYVILKWAQSKDGFLDKKRKGESGVNWITQPRTKLLTHQWRSEEDAILVGKNTVLIDNPSLTVREWAGKNPLRVVLDSQTVISNAFNVVKDGNATLIYNTKKNTKEKACSWLQLTNMDVQAILKNLAEKSVLSVIVEGGREVLRSFIEQDLWDEARILTGEKQFLDGIKAPEISGTKISDTTFGTDTIKIIRNQ